MANSLSSIAKMKAYLVHEIENHYVIIRRMNANRGAPYFGLETREEEQERKHSWDSSYRMHEACLHTLEYSLKMLDKFCIHGFNE